MLCVALASLAGCHQARTDADSVLAALFSGTGAEWIDMSYAYDESTIFWPTAQPFELEVVSAGMTEGGYYYAANNFRLAEHGGTHLDAPIHFSQGSHTAEQIPLERLVGAGEEGAFVDLMRRGRAYLAGRGQSVEAK